jgi:hypothetical protein
MMETLHSSETSVPTTATRRNIPEDSILLVFVLFVSRSSKQLLHLSGISGLHSGDYEVFYVLE